MAGIAEVAAGSYRVETRCHQVEPATDRHVVVRDLTPWFVPDGSQIERDSCAIQDHATARLNFVFADDELAGIFGDDEIPWSSMRLRPSMRLVSLDGRGETDWYNLGVFLPETPHRSADENPKSYAVDCHDLIHTLGSATGVTVSVAAGQLIQIQLEELFALQSSSGMLLLPTIPLMFPSRIPVAFDTQRIWPIDQDVTWLLIIDQMLEAAGWRPPWITADGDLTSDRWRDPLSLDAEMVISDGDASSIALGASNKADTYGVPNRWVFVQVVHYVDDPVNVVTRDNISDGPSSQEARGRLVTSVQHVDVVDLSALEDFADRAVLADTLPQRTLCLDVAPQPLPWHRSVVEATISDLGLDQDKHLIRSWVLPLDGADASLILDGLTFTGRVAPPPAPPTPDPPTPTTTNRLMLDGNLLLLDSNPLFVIL